MGVVQSQQSPWPPRLPDAIRRWKAVTVHLPGWVIDEFSELARVLGKSRVSLMRDALITAGLAYARGLAKGKQTAAPDKVA